MFYKIYIMHQAHIVVLYNSGRRFLPWSLRVEGKAFTSIKIFKLILFKSSFHFETTRYFKSYHRGSHFMNRGCSSLVYGALPLWSA